MTADPEAPAPSRGGRRLPAVALAAASLVAALVAAAPALGGGTPAPNPVEPTTPVFSARRAPELTTRVVANAHLQVDLRAVLGAPHLAGTTTCLTVADPDGRSVLDHGRGRPLIPASTIKLLTTATALARLGPESTYRTEVRAAATPGPDGAVGDLWLVGGGDPLLGTADFAEVAGWQGARRDFTSIEHLADRVFNAGVRSVGRVVGDESRYDTQRYVPSWKATYATTPEVGPQSALVVNSGFVQWRPRAVPAPAPATHAAGVLARLLAERGIAVGAVGEGVAPAGLPVLAHMDSPPLRVVVRVILQDSDNLGAELLLKELGLRFGAGGTTAAGMEVVAAGLAPLGAASQSFRGVDGSGLDRGNRLTCDLLDAVLADAGTDGVLAATMPRAGRSGTLVRRFEGTPAEGDVRAKTGSLNGVTGLAGWATGHDGRVLRFALLANDLPSDAAGFALQDAVAVALATYPRAPAPDAVSPLPAGRPAAAER